MSVHASPRAFLDPSALLSVCPLLTLFKMNLEVVPYDHETPPF